MSIRESRPTGDGAHVKQTPTRLDLYGLVYILPTVVWKTDHLQTATWRRRSKRHV